MSLPQSPPRHKRNLSDSSHSSSKRACSVDTDETEELPGNNSATSLVGSRLHIMDPSGSKETTPPLISPSRMVSEDPFVDGQEVTTTVPGSAPPSYDTLSPSTPLPNQATPLSYPSVQPTRDRPDPSNQLVLIKELKQEYSELSKDDKWYLVARNWYRRWETACSGIAESKEDDLGVEVDEVGPIDNRGLADELGNLKKGLVEGSQLVLLPAPVWDYLSGWYGISGPVFQRQVVGNETFQSERVEFYPPVFYLQLLLSNNSLLSPSSKSTARIEFSCGEELTTLKNYARIEYNLGGLQPLRLWRLKLDSPTANRGYVTVSELEAEGAELVQKDDGKVTESSTLSQALLDDETNRIVVEQQLEGKWLVDEKKFVVALPAKVEVKKITLFGGNQGFFNKKEEANKLVPKYGKNSTASSSKSLFGSSSQSGSASTGFMNSLTGALTRTRSSSRMSGQRGLTGLQNLGNTCFMNSALQCMSNTKELQEYFTSGVYRNELNRDNPLGMGGQVAEGFGQLIERLWSTSGGAVPPREFKQALSKFAPSFSGYGQQDSQELLAFLLDGTHEDLNRIKKKPATNAPDWVMGGGDKELVEMAKACWEQYRSRNDSVIVDLFQGQYRSTVVCPDCSKVSITFDPFMYVTTNLPINKKWSGKIIYVPLDPASPRVSLHIELPKLSTIKTAKSAVAQFMGCDARTLVVAEEWHSKFWKSWYDDDMVTEIQANDFLIFFETTAVFPQPKPRFYGKSKPVVKKVVDPDAPIVIAVAHSARKEGKLKQKYGGGSDRENFGKPFLLSLTREEASTFGGIQKALIKQYSRVTKRGEELLTWSGEDTDILMTSGVNSPAPTPTSEFAMSTPLPPTPPEDSAMDVDELTPDSSSLTIINDSPTPAATPSISDAIFQIMVSKSTKKDGVLPFESGDYPTFPISLVSRSTHASASPDFSPPGEIPGAFPSNDLPTPIESPEATSPLPTPLVFTGDYIVTEWTNEAHEYYFGGTGTDAQSLFEEVVDFVDPAIKKEIERKGKGGKKQAITIQDCLKEFTKEERLGEDDTWYCPDCKKHQQATKKVEIWKVPDVLVFALKRFSSSRYSRDKIDDFVDFPIEGFNLEEFVEGDKVEKRLASAGVVTVEEPGSLIYDLYAVDNHYGGMGGGHYTAYAKNHENGKWYDFDDSRVSEMSDPEKVRTSAAYLLFYRRRTTQALGAKSRGMVDSALQSRSASVNGSSAPSPAISRSPSPEPSRDTIFPAPYNNDFDDFSAFRSGPVSETGSDKAEIGSRGSSRANSPFGTSDGIMFEPAPLGEYGIIPSHSRERSLSPDEIIVEMPEGTESVLDEIE